MEVKNPSRRPTVAEWEAFWEIRKVVAQHRGLRGEPKLLWEALWWELQLCRGGAVDVTAAQLAFVIGAADAKSGRIALGRLVEIGLVVVHYEDRASGYKTVSMPDPRDVLTARRHGSHGQGELFDPWADEPGEATATDPESPPLAIRHLGSQAAAQAPALAPRQPPSSRTAHVREDAPAHVPEHVPAGHLEHLDPSIDGNFNLAHRSSIAQELSVSSDSRGASAGRCAAAGRENPFVSALIGLSVDGDDEATIARKVDWLRGQIPGLWYEIARWLIEELMDLHGPSKFNMGELAKILGKTRGKQERGELTRPPAVYFAGACEHRFAQLNRPWPKFVPAKPR